VSAQSFTTILISNARIFDGVSGQLEPGHRLISDRKIKQISAASIAPPTNTTVLDAWR
jgi:imidazolonepropionase-like amidohydrolase